MPVCSVTIACRTAKARRESVNDECPDNAAASVALREAGSMMRLRSTEAPTVTVNTVA